MFSNNKIVWIKFLRYNQFIGWNLNISWSNWLRKGGERPTAAACFRVERWGDLKQAALSSLYVAVYLLFVEVQVSFFTAPASLELFTHKTIDYRPETRPISKWVQNLRCVAMIEKPLPKYASTVNALWTFVHSLLLTELPMLCIILVQTIFTTSIVYTSVVV